jgi:hypothetical protein
MPLGYLGPRFDLSLSLCFSVLPSYAAFHIERRKNASADPPQRIAEGSAVAGSC